MPRARHTRAASTDSSDEIRASLRMVAPPAPTVPEQAPLRVLPRLAIHEALVAHIKQRESTDNG